MKRIAFWALVTMMIYLLILLPIFMAFHSLEIILLIVIVTFGISCKFQADVIIAVHRSAKNTKKKSLEQYCLNTTTDFYLKFGFMFCLCSLIELLPIGGNLVIPVEFVLLSGGLICYYIGYCLDVDGINYLVRFAAEELFTHPVPYYTKQLANGLIQCTSIRDISVIPLINIVLAPLYFSTMAMIGSSLIGIYHSSEPIEIPTKIRNNLPIYSSINSLNSRDLSPNVAAHYIASSESFNFPNASLSNVELYCGIRSFDLYNRNSKEYW